ncbi:AraC family ligand binding domain-containing protein [Planococcus sp. NCCP-2050]|uniref:AraC family ligand binding domain-containing protein n=1 Tax=Planococcus sp. NCCP-2050 TaxID=2944679 RepID=UPI00204138EF|nr:AraC family ligand binding domain-containing protein [Planococcus sp. NCCP-2050]GKW45723.1 hypothetical protein NCCP2050_14150 [Planococcus sp. NCCP-2050]
MEVIETPHMLGEKQKHIQKLTSFENTTIVNIQLEKEEIILEHDVDADVIIIVKKGKVTFKVDRKTVQLTPENMLHMKPKEKHSLKAEEASDLIVMQIKP